MQVKDLVEYIHELAPPHLQENYDNSGLLVGHSDDEIKAVLICLDVTEEVVNEAEQLGANLIVSHHPIIFGGINRLTGRNYVERVVREAIKKDINLFAVHTNLDNVLENGVSKNIADILGLQNVQILRVKESNEERLVGTGVTGSLRRPMEEKEFLKYLRDKMNIACLRYTKLRGQPIRKVAICGGSGSFLVEDAISAGADIFISADFKYHQFFDAENKIVIADIGHYESEQFTVDMLYRILTNKFNTFATHCTKINTNPVNYF